MDVALGVMVMLPGVLAALARNDKLKYLGFAVSFLMTIAAMLGLLR